LIDPSPRQTEAFRQIHLGAGVVRRHGVELSLRLRAYSDPEEMEMVKNFSVPSRTASCRPPVLHTGQGGPASCGNGPAGQRAGLGSLSQGLQWDARAFFGARNRSVHLAQPTAKERTMEIICPVCGATAEKFGSTVIPEPNYLVQCKVAQSSGEFDAFTFKCPHMTKAIAEADD
jgi:hypothetical protein